MVKQFNFNIEGELPCSKLCKAKGLSNFISLCNYIKNLPYGRTKNRRDFISVLKENKGTCSTKHAFLKQVAIENNQDSVKLYIGIYKMNTANTKGIGNVLKNNNLDYIPEAHTYLKINNEIIDVTTNTRSETSFKNTLVFEEEIQPIAIGDYKVKLHKKYLKQWIIDNKMNLPFKTIWHIRELCIAALSE